MSKLQTFKLISFVLAVAMLLVAVLMLVLLFALPDPLIKYEPDETLPPEEQAGQQFGWALAAIFGIALFLFIFVVHIGYCIAPVVMSARQFFAGKRRAIPMLVMHLVSVLALSFVTIIAFVDPFLVPVFTALITASLILAAVSVAFDFLILFGKDGENTVQA